MTISDVAAVHQLFTAKKKKKKKIVITVHGFIRLPVRLFHISLSSLLGTHALLIKDSDAMNP